MKYLVDVCLIAAILLIIWLTQGWWQLLAVMPFIVLLISTNPGHPERHKGIGPRSGGRSEIPLNYTVVERDGERIQVECLCPVQFDGGWCHFTNEVTKAGYHPHLSFYMPRSVILGTFVKMED